MKIGLRVNKGDKEFKRVEDATVEIGIGGASSEYNYYLETCNVQSSF